MSGVERHPFEMSSNPVDPVAVARDDALIDSLLSGDADAGADPALARLAHWIDGLDDLPDDELQPTRLVRRRRRRAAVTASIVLGGTVAMSGVAAAAITAAPGSLFYPLHQLFTGAPSTPSIHTQI